MAENSNISWTDHTFNPWEGCTKVSDGCKFCYAEAWNRRFAGGMNWGKGAPRRRTSADNWKKPLRWNRMKCFSACPSCGHQPIPAITNNLSSTYECGMCNGENRHITTRRPRVFCASLADWLDDAVPVEWLADLLALIHATPNLDWLLLTKRPENWYRRLSACEGEPAESWIDCYDMPERGVIPENVWIGATVENQEYADRRIPELLKIPARVRFLSVEPMLGPVDFSAFMGICPNITGERIMQYNAGIHWIICGGESGPQRRPFEIKWAADLAAECAAARVPFFMKQDAHARSGQQWRIPDELWKRKEFPRV